MDPMIKNSFFTILIYWNDNRIHLGLTKKLIFFILFPPLFVHFLTISTAWSVGQIKTIGGCSLCRVARHPGPDEGEGLSARGGSLVTGSPLLLLAP